jgi:hypothetical protein
MSYLYEVDIVKVVSRFAGAQVNKRHEGAGRQSVLMVLTENRSLQNSLGSVVGVDRVWSQQRTG